jgi:hypothetical protein
LQIKCTRFFTLPHSLSSAGVSGFAAVTFSSKLKRANPVTLKTQNGIFVSLAARLTVSSVSLAVLSNSSSASLPSTL